MDGPPRLLDGRLKLRHLLLADALAEQGSVVAAARSLHITQPAATRALHELEDILGVALYERGPRGIAPTVFGVAFTEHARSVLAQLRQAGQHVSDLAHAEQGTVTVGTHLAGSNVLLPRAIARVKAAHPRLTVIVHEAAPETLLTDLEAGRIDCIVGRITAPGRRAGTTRKTLYDEPIVLVCRDGHPAARSSRLTLAGLARFPWIIPGAGVALRWELEQVFLRHHVDLPENRIECTSILTNRYLLAETNVIAALPLLIGREQPGLVVLPVSLEPISHTVGVTLPAARPLTPSAQALMRELEDVARQMHSSIMGG